jgi:hypothetical protein
VVLLIASAGGVSANSSWKYQNDERGSGAWIFFCCTRDIGEFRACSPATPLPEDKRREREMDDRGCAEELIEVY